ncbi:TPA: glycoside hydrolase [Candidatus Poribacteria bacterium]|nr:glycoside hydrolase [Candidatus Poribacteria bacterium]
MPKTKPLYIAFVWHHHQPYYKDLTTGEYILPWVRMHGIKDYYDMAAILKEYPNVRQTFNFTPVLIEQINDYTNGKAQDRFIRLTLKDPSELTQDEQALILYNCFIANRDNMIMPYPRYAELLSKRGHSTMREDLLEVTKRFSEQDFNDLQVWFNLVWFDPTFQAEDGEIRRLIQKGRGYTQDDKELIIAKQIEITSRILPLYKEMQEQGQIEITLSPYYHPILPLICDTDSAKIAMPDVPLPKNRFTHPEDAYWHVYEGVRLYEATFGTKPRGMWPSEGAVSEEIIPIIARAGIQWIASDEWVLAKSRDIELKRDANGYLCEPEILYQPYSVEYEGYSLNIIFRDHFLSDLIGFRYSSWSPKDAVSDFLHRLRRIRDMVNPLGGNHLVSIILDGENAWEYYPNDGADFLNLLYQNLNDDPAIQAVTVEEYLEHHSAKILPSLPKLFPGSWINHDFAVWIGGEEDNLAWDYLKQARDALYKVNADEIDAEKIHQAWRGIYICEGSDWWWWYGDDRSSPNDADFDFMFRNNLSRVYELIDEEIPVHLYESICKETIVGLSLAPKGLISPDIDGFDSNYYEWLLAGLYDASRGGGTMHRAENIIRRIYYGFDLKTLYLRLDTNLSMKSDDVVNLELEIIILKPHLTKITVPFTGARVIISTADKDGHWREVKRISDVAINKIVELAVSFQDLKVKANDKLEFMTRLTEKGLELERCPVRGAISVFAPPEDYERIFWPL